MQVLDSGHKYRLASLDGDAEQDLVFVKRFRGVENHAGTTNQEVLRALIHRVTVLDAEASWEGNSRILQHLRLALVLHESRALERKVEKGDILPETIATSAADGHYILSQGDEQ